MLLMMFLLQTLLFAEDSIPPLTRPLMDSSGALSASETAAIENSLSRLNSTGVIQFAIYLPQSIGDQTIEEFALKVAEAWKLGKKGKDEGLLWVIALKDRKMRFEVGYGLEGALTDIATKRIQEDRVKPYFKAGRIGDGILSGIQSVGQALNVVSNDAPPPSEPRRKKGSLPLPILLILVLFGIIKLISTPFMPRRYQRDPDFGFRRNSVFGSGLGGGLGGGRGFGGFGGGGGSFGGGGSSSSW